MTNIPDVYVQGEKGLISLEKEVTAESVINALGYTPANADDIIKDIDETDDSAVHVVDKYGFTITRTDEEGFHAAAMTVNGKDVESGLVTDEDRESWGGSDLDDVISKDDDSTLYIMDKNGNVIAKIDKDGLHAIEVYIKSEDGEKTVAGMLAALVDSAPDTLNTLNELATAIKEHHDVTDALDEAITDKANAIDFENHKKDNNVHLGNEINLEDNTALCIVDKDNNIIAQFDGTGLNVADLKINHVSVEEHVRDIIENNGDTCSHTWKNIPGMDDLTPEPDCTTWRRMKYCPQCGKTHAALIRTDHVWDINEDVEPTCIKPGYITYICQECLAGKGPVTIPALGHDWDVEVVVTPPTCTEQGYTTHYCNNCDETYVDAETEPLGHNEVSHDAKSATCTEKGWNAHVTCSRCDYTTKVEIAALGHAPGNTIIENEIDGTVHAKGSYENVIYCTTCNEELSRKKVTIQDESDGTFSYRLLGDDTYAVSANITSVTSQINIPKVYKNRSVTSIISAGFKNLSGTSQSSGIALPDSITYIPAGAFKDCNVIRVWINSSAVTSKWRVVGTHVHTGASIDEIITIQNTDDTQVTQYLCNYYVNCVWTKQE